jgi:type I restriction enzyme M protein
VRTNSGLRSSEYSTPVLGLIFLRFADVKFSHADQRLRAELPANSRRTIGPADYQALGVMYLPDAARYSRLMRLPEGADIGTALNDAMRAIEAENPDLRDTLPKTYNQPGLTRDVLWSLMGTFANIPLDTRATSSARFTNTSWANLPRIKAPKAANSSPPPPSSN